MEAKTTSRKQMTNTSKDSGERDPYILLIQMQISAATMRVFKKLKIELLYDPALPLLHICPAEAKSASNRDTCTPLIIIA
jgi:hypothetical protein